jgi:hypothetical protein
MLLSSKRHRGYDLLFSFASLALCSVVCYACSKSASFGTAKVAPNERPTKIEHEPCEPSSNDPRVDSNNDGKPDIIHVMKGSKEICTVLDLNFDNINDRYKYYDEKGQLRRIESSYGFGKRQDEVAHYQNGVLIRIDRQFHLDNKFDTWDVYENGKLARRERDKDGDGKIDEWWTFPDASKPDCPIVASDADGDGKPDVGSEVDMCKDDYVDPNAPPPSSASAKSSAAPPPPPPPPASGSAWLATPPVPTMAAFALPKRSPQ